MAENAFVLPVRGNRVGIREREKLFIAKQNDAEENASMVPACSEHRLYRNATSLPTSGGHAGMTA